MRVNFLDYARVTCFRVFISREGVLVCLLGGEEVSFVIFGILSSLLRRSGDSDRLVIARALFDLRSTAFGDGFRV